MLEAAKAEIRRGLELAHSAVANANLATGKQQAQGVPRSLCHFAHGSRRHPPRRSDPPARPIAEAANVELRATIARLEEENAKLRGGAAPAKAEPPASLVRVGGPGAEGYDVPCAAEEGVDLAKCVGAAKFKAWAGAASRPPRVNVMCAVRLCKRDGISNHTRFTRPQPASAASSL